MDLACRPPPHACGGPYPRLSGDHRSSVVLVFDRVLLSPPPPPCLRKPVRILTSELDGNEARPPSAHRLAAPPADPARESQHRAQCGVRARAGRAHEEPDLTR